MHASTPAVTQRVRAAATTEAKVAALRDAYRGQRCVIVTCGPSLSEITPAQLNAALDGVLTIAVKQAVHVVGRQADLLCFNSYNVRRFDLDNRDTLRVYAPEPSGLMVQHNRYDLALPMASHEADLAQSLAGTRDFARYELDRTLARPWGPGIVHELALYLGVTEVFTVGWDIAAGSTANVHFDDQTAEAAFFSAGRDRRPTLAGVRGRMPPVAKRVLRTARSVAAHHRGQPYNRVTMLPGEGAIVARALPATRDWLASHGADLRIVTGAAGAASAGDVATTPTPAFLSQLDRAATA